MRGVEELASVLLGNGFDRDSVGDTGDEIAAVLARGERGQGGAKCIGRFFRGRPLIIFVAVHGAKDPPPGLAATLDSGIVEGRVGAADGVVGCCDCVVRHRVSLGRSRRGWFAGFAG